jgi:PAS domain S-box-containing protein
VRSVQGNISPELDSEGQPNGAIAAFIDITDRKRTQEALHASLERYRSYIEVTGELGWTTNADGEVVEDIPSFRKFTGQTNEEVKGWGWSKALHPDDLEHTTQIWRQAVKSKSNYEVEYRLRRHDGIYRYFLARGAPVFKENGSIREWVGTCIDITERKGTEDELRKSRDELELRVRERTAELANAYKELKEQSRILESFFKYTVTPLVFLDRDFNFIRVNEAYAKACRREVSEFPGYNHFEFYPSDAKAKFEQVVETREPYQAIAGPFTFPDRPEWGTSYWDWTLTPVLDDTGEVESLVFSLEDVTERKRAEEALRESENRLRALSSQLLTAQESERKRIAMELHDGIGQMLTAIKFKVESILQEKGKGEARAKEKSLEAVIPMIRESVEEVRRIQMDLRPSTLDDLGVLATLGWFCREYQKIYSHIHIEKEIGLKEDEVSTPLRTVIYRLTQEAMNNIAKHSQADLIHLSLRRMENKIELFIKDNGIGFDLEEILSSEGSKRGLGLNSMRERTELSGGTFAIESTKGKGTVIRASWPT